jgi:tetratricopeptide (TPR) repeat protein
MLAQTYNLATRALIKLEASGLEWISADRALTAAGHAEDPLTFAEAKRLMGSACRRAGRYDRALSLTLEAADELTVGTTQPPVQHLALQGLLFCSASYACARSGDRDRAVDLLHDADAVAARLDGYPVQQHALTANILSHRVSAEYVLGNAGLALHHARKAPVSGFPDRERHARFLVDIALSFAQVNKPDRAYRTLLTAERAAPGEVRTRATVRGLVGDLLVHRNQAALPGLHELAARTHALV